MNPYKIFVESMYKAGIDKYTIDAVAAIHNAIYEAAERDFDDDDDEDDDKNEDEKTNAENKDNKEEMVDDEDFDQEEFDSGKTDETLYETEGELSNDDGAKAIMYNILTLMNSKQNAYQQYHWNAESKSLHETSQECYELYQDTKDKVAETLQATFNENIDFKVWSGKIPNLTDKGAFLASVDEDLDKISEFRSQLEHFETFGLNGLLDGFIDELTGIKYHLIRFFENKDV
jgi:flagellin-like hook-associated protein FlgL